MVQRTRSTGQYDPKFPWLDSYLYRGADPEGENGGEGESAEGDTGGATGDAGTGKDGDKGTAPAVTVSLEEYETLKARMVAADRAKSESEAKLREITDKDKSEKEIAERNAEEAKAEAEELRNEARNLKIQNAFLTDNTHNWHNPKRALQIADLSDVSINDKGEVIGLKAALDKVAKSDPYLLKSEDGDSGGGNGQPTGSGRDGKNGKTNNADANREALKKKYPVLNR